MPRRIYEWDEIDQNAPGVPEQSKEPGKQALKAAPAHRAAEAQRKAAQRRGSAATPLARAQEAHQQEVEERYQLTGGLSVDKLLRSLQREEHEQD